MPVLYGDLPDDDEPISELLERKAKRFERKAKRAERETWLPITVPELQGRPFGVVWFGDFHLDDDGCNVPRLLRDLELCAGTPGCYGVHIGDATNNWIGRLNSEHGNQSTTVRDGRRLARHVIRDSGVTWLLWLLGNHDLWNEGGPILSMIADGATHVAEWDARIELRAGRSAWRVHAAHAFAGNSQWNSAHGPMKAAMMGGEAELYVAGHIHTPATAGFETAGGRYNRAVQARGYKHFDKYAKRHGYRENRNGAAVLSIFNPDAETPAGRVATFEDLALGCRLLSLLRADYDAAANQASRPKTRQAQTRRRTPGKAKVRRKRQ